MSTPAELREQASESFRKEHESFERCDTDGFMSQWAHGLSGRKSNMEADLLENGGMATFWGLFDGERRVAAKQIEGPFGSVWLLTDEEAARYGRTFVPMGGNSKVQKMLGLHQAEESAPAKAVYRGTNVVSVGVYYERTDGGYPGALDKERRNVSLES